MNKCIIYLSFSIVLWFFVNTAGTLAGIHLLADRVIFWLAVILAIYVYAGYPFALKILSESFYSPIKRKEIFPDVTLLICAYNEEEIIEDKIKNCFELEYPSNKLKIVIASDGSEDRTNEIVKRIKDEKLILIEYPVRRGKVSVINSTVPILDSEIVVFSDANTMYQKDAIKKLVRNFNDPSVGGVSSDVILHNERSTYGKSETLYYLYERWIQNKESKIGSIIGADGGMYAIRRNLFIPPSSNIILDDFVISMRVVLSGYRLVYEKEAIGHEQSPTSLKVEFLRKSRVIAGAIQSVCQKEGVPTFKQKKLLFSYASHKFLRWMIPILLLLVFITNIRLFIFSGESLYSTTLIIQSLFYFLAVSDLFIAKKHNNRITSIPFYFCLENGAALYGIYKGLFNKQPVKWQKFSREAEKI